MSNQTLRKTTVDFAVNAIRRVKQAGAKAGCHFSLSKTKSGASLVMKFPSVEDAEDFCTSLHLIAGVHRMIEVEKETV